MNIPSLKILDGIGFDAAINRASLLMGITDPSQIRSRFPRVYSLGLGISSTSPAHMARAFAIFGNQGREVTPIAIRSVEDRSGRVVLDPEREFRLQQRRAGSDQVISPQNAYIMSRILEKTVEEGSLAAGAGWGSKFTFRDENGRTFRMPVAGKTGTTQNWSDAWAVGYSPYYTTAIWFGFDRPGNSLGVELTGSTLNGHVFGDFMREIHQGLPYRDFAKPAAGIIDVTVCAKSGLLKTPACNAGDVNLPFLIGTQPTQACETHGRSSTIVITTMRENTMGLDDSVFLNSLSMPTLPPDFESPATQNPGNQNRNRNTRTTNTRTNNRGNSQSNRNTPNAASSPPLQWTWNNPLLDGDSDWTAPESENLSTRPETFYEDPAAAENAEGETKLPQAATDDSASTTVPGSDPGFGLEMPSYNPLLD